MARHTRRLPRNRQEREHADRRATGLLLTLKWQADETRELEDAARESMHELRQRILRHVQNRELDISDMAEVTGISRQTIHQLVRTARTRSASGSP